MSSIFQQHTRVSISLSIENHESREKSTPRELLELSLDVSDAIGIQYFSVIRLFDFIGIQYSSVIKSFDFISFQYLSVIKLFDFVGIQYLSVIKLFDFIGFQYLSVIKLFGPWPGMGRELLWVLIAPCANC